MKNFIDLLYCLSLVVVPMGILLKYRYLDKRIERLENLVFPNIGDLETAKALRFLYELDKKSKQSKNHVDELIKQCNDKEVNHEKSSES